LDDEKCVRFPRVAEDQPSRRGFGKDDTDGRCIEDRLKTGPTLDQCHLSLFALSYVAMDTHPFDNDLLPINNRNSIDLKQPPLAVATSHPVLELEGAAVCDGGIPRINCRLRIIGMHRLSPAIAVIFVTSLAGKSSDHPGCSPIISAAALLVHTTPDTAPTTARKRACKPSASVIPDTITAKPIGGASG
jgi:hypothetical protein